MSKATSVDRAVSSIFVLGSTASARRSEDKPRREPAIDLASMSREELGGVEYRALRVLLKVAIGTSQKQIRWIAHIDYDSRVFRRSTSLWSHLPSPMDPYRARKVPRLPRLTGSR